MNLQTYEQRYSWISIDYQISLTRSFTREHLTCKNVYNTETKCFTKPKLQTHSQ